MTYDPSWLPSTVAQSTAALVAIIGGFMVSRFITIDSEMRGAQRRLDEATQRRQSLEAEHEQVKRDLTYRLAHDFLTSGSRLEHLVSNEPVKSAVELLDEDESTSLTVDELEPYLREAVTVIQDAKLALKRLPELATDVPREWDDARRLLGLPSDQWNDLRAALYYDLMKRFRELQRAQRKQRNPFAIDIPDFTSTTIPMIASSRHDDAIQERLLDRRDQNARDLATALAEVALAERAVLAIGRPSGLLAGIALLTVLTACGLVLPVGALALEPSAYDTRSRVLVLTGFLIGIGVLLTYLWGYAIRLRTRVRPNDHT